MRDAALAFDPVNYTFDLALAGGDLVSEYGLFTAVAISLFTDRLAEASDRLPYPASSGFNDDIRRGWWGDLPIGGAAELRRRDLIGSRLWLLRRALVLPDLLPRARGYCREALQWLIDDDIAESVVAVASLLGLDKLAIKVTITRRVSGRPVNHVFDLIWNASVS